MVAKRGCWPSARLGYRPKGSQSCPGREGNTVTIGQPLGPHPTGSQGAFGDNWARARTLGCSSQPFSITLVGPSREITPPPSSPPYPRLWVESVCLLFNRALSICLCELGGGPSPKVLRGLRQPVDPTSAPQGAPHGEHKRCLSSSYPSVWPPLRDTPPRPLPCLHLPPASWQSQALAHPRPRRRRLGPSPGKQVGCWPGCGPG